MSEQAPDHREIQRMLGELHDRLEQAEPLDEDEQAMLRHLMGDIRDMLDRSGEAETPQFPPDHPIKGRLAQAIDRFEVTNPDLTLAIKQVLDTLSIAGI